MSKGKYSPFTKLSHWEDCIYNAFGNLPIERADDEPYDEKTMFGNYDKNGYDSYGYSAFDRKGNYVGIGDGVDVEGFTEMDYLIMSDEEFERITS